MQLDERPQPYIDLDYYKNLYEQGIQIINALDEQLNEKEVDKQLGFAEQQLMGYFHATKGHGLIELIEAMGLTKDEWVKLQDKYGLEYIDEEDKKAIDKHFNL